MRNSGSSVPPVRSTDETSGLPIYSVSGPRRVVRPASQPQEVRIGTMKHPKQFRLATRSFDAVFRPAACAGDLSET
ncbi:hypothetical protein GHJ90_26370 [Sinorhizobium meliloti]|nr:hypothetical protein [Sinorhizobium meliloti]